MAKRKLTEEITCPSCKQQYFRSPEYDEPACYMCKRNMERKGFYDAFVAKANGTRFEDIMDKVIDDSITYYQDMEKYEQFDNLLTEANARLETDGIALRIERRGDKLNLRAELLPKPGSKGRAKTQRFSLGLGANLEALKVAEAQAKAISGQLSLQ